MSLFLEKNIKFLKGVGAQRAEILAAHLGIHTVGDLLSHYPIRHEDRSKIFTIAELQEGVSVQLSGIVKPIGWEGEGKTKRYKAVLQDKTGVLELVWFSGGTWVEKKLQEGAIPYVIFGKPQLFRNSFSMPHPEMEEADKYLIRGGNSLTPIYSISETARKRKIDNKVLTDIIRNAIFSSDYAINETLNPEIIGKYKFLPKLQAIAELHNPSSAAMLEKAKQRLKYEELFFLSLRHLMLRQNNKTNYKGPVFNHLGHYFQTFYHHHLPFELTQAQKKVLREIRNDFLTGCQMNRLLQGDVGSGKTIVALIACLIAVDNGFQACIMAPTEILAAQHYQSFAQLLQAINIKPVLLTGSTRKKERTPLLQGIEDGSISIVIGTHALLEDTVKYKQLGLVIIDEQHRFGVAQRAKLYKKGNDLVPHVLVMTATPIPRTLALTIYGELDVSIIDELPAGRKPIKTVHRYQNQRSFVMDFCKQQIAAGRQIYIVFPLIEDSEHSEKQSLMSGYDLICSYLPTPQYKYSLVHGRMKPEEKEAEMQHFKHHRTQIMIATTVIEVGVNVPNASIMIIENAESFGLAQLHQLRGRVGRGSEQSYCILLTDTKMSNTAKKRIKTMVESTDGFFIAQVDMELRGPGDMDGTKQSGLLDLKLAELKTDEKILIAARQDAERLINQDPELEQAFNFYIRAEYNRIPNRTVWSKIS